MTVKYFEQPFEPQNLKAQYKTLCKKLHPDCGGNEPDFVEMKNEYDFLIGVFSNSTKNEGEDYHYEPEADVEFAKKIDAIIHLPLIIEVIGNWLWVSGDTYSYKDFLKSQEFKFSGQKKMWYWHHDHFRKKSRKNYSIDEIRDMFDRQSHNTVSRK